MSLYYVHSYCNILCKFCQYFTHVLLVFTGEKAKDFNSSISRLFKELKGYKWLIGIAIVLAIAGSVLSIFTPNKLSDVTDKIQEGLMGNMNITAIRNLSLLLLFLYICSAICTYIQAILMANISNKFARDLRGRISRKINR